MNPESQTNSKETYDGIMPKDQHQAWQNLRQRN